MGRQLKLLMMHVLAAAVAAAMLLAVAPSARADPNYTVERCCDLCPQAANRGAYTTGFLQSFTTLVQGKDGWLFRTDDDLRTSFGPDAEGMKSLKRLNAALKSRGVELVMV
jgi:alginate biosynthesis protein AlgX